MKREELIKIVGEENVIKLEQSNNFEPTDRPMKRSESHLVEYMKALDCYDLNNQLIGIEAYYLISNEFIEENESNEIDWTQLINWVPDNYEVV